MVARLTRLAPHHVMLVAALLTSILLLSACTPIGYYAHLARGQFDLLSRREAIHKILADPHRDEQLRRRLQMVQTARQFASNTLALPDNNSYTSYADLERDYAVINVFATPEFSLKAVDSCFPIAGCVAYRGYYDRARAESRATELRQQGLDVELGRSPAYSTLGWFDDPVLNTMMNWDDNTLIGTLFHELAHQRLYVAGDTQFNESYASFVEQAGLRAYLGGQDPDEENRSARKARRQQFVELILAVRESLNSLYDGPSSSQTKRQEKARLFADLQAQYAQLRDSQWNGAPDYDAWFERDLNNASLLPIGLYDQWVSAFEKIFLMNDGNWPDFHAACKALGELSEADRHQQLNALM